MLSRTSHLFACVACLCAVGALAAAGPAVATPAVAVYGSGQAGPATATAAMAAPAGTKVYAGSTSHGELPLVMEVRNGRVTRLVAEYGGSCFAYGHESVGAKLKTPSLSSGGKVSLSVSAPVTNASTIFTNSSSAAVRVVERVRATFGARIAKGTIQATATFADGSTCKGDTEQFTITHERGRYYGGVTSQEMPAVLELDANRKEVHHLHLGWMAECADGSFTVVPDFLVDFPIAGGRWGDVFTQNYETPSLRYTLSYDIKGTLGLSSGSGRFSVDIAGVDSSGAVQEGCNTRVVTYAVRS